MLNLNNEPELFLSSQRKVAVMGQSLTDTSPLRLSLGLVFYSPVKVYSR